MTTKSMIEDFAENKYFIGVVMITMNIGARFLIDELTPEQKKVLNSQNFRRFIACAFFAATRDILAAVTLTIIFILFVSEAFTDTEDMKNKKKKNNRNRYSK